VTARILVVDDEHEVGNFFTFLLEPKGYEVKVVENGAQAREAIKEPFHLVILDLKLPDVDGLTILREIKASQPECEVIMMTGYSTVKSAVEAIHLGAFDYLEKPFSDLEELERVINRALTRATAKAETFSDEERERVLESLGFIAGRSEKMHRLLLIAEKLARKNITILIRGETGSGKELLARFIHAMSPRAEKPFLAINCGALPESLLESELFGYEKGAFTGATGQRKGIFELAHRGTLLLDEVGDASPSIQVKLLRVLETGEIFRLGGEKPIRVDVRLLAATNADLEELVKQKRFREDLFYRLDVVTLTVPPLRERKEDIPLLAESFLAKHYPSGKVPLLSPEVVAALQSYEWPGNVRELANVIAQVAAVCDTPTVLPEHLPPKIYQRRGRVQEEEQQDFAPPSPSALFFADLSQRLHDFVKGLDLTSGFDLPGFLEGFKHLEVEAARLIIDQALKETQGRYPDAARILKTTPRVLRYLKKEKRPK